MVFLHYLRIRFGVKKDGVPAIYDFFFEHLPRALHALGEHTVNVRIERLEPLNAFYSQIAESPDEIRHLLEKFARSHHLKQAPSIVVNHERTSLAGRVAIKSLESLFNDYNVLFDMFFADIQVHGHKIGIDMMDAFDNSVLALSPEKLYLQQFQHALQKSMGPMTEFEWAEPPVHRPARKTTLKGKRSLAAPSRKRASKKPRHTRSKTKTKKTNVRSTRSMRSRTAKKSKPKRARKR